MLSRMLLLEKSSEKSSSEREIGVFSVCVKFTFVEIVKDQKNVLSVKVCTILQTAWQKTLKLTPQKFSRSQQIPTAFCYKLLKSFQ